MVECATQTMAPDVFTQHVQTCESEQGTVQPADDGRADTRIPPTVFVGRDLHDEELQSVVDVQRFGNQEFCDLDAVQ